MPHTSKEFRESWLDEKILMSNYFPWKQNQLVSVQSRFNDEPIHNSQAQQKNTENYHPSPPVLHLKQKPKAQPQQNKKKKSYKYSRVYLYRTRYTNIRAGALFSTAAVLIALDIVWCVPRSSGSCARETALFNWFHTHKNRQEREMMIKWMMVQVKGASESRRGKKKSSFDALDVV